jgi:glycosyltransferase involved in cell wall biosynthesis
MTTPKVSVIMATWGRGRHILPSIRSALGQSFPDFELLVVGDACVDDTEAVVRSIDDPRLRWINLEARVGSQSGPNNAGIAAARGGIIAYLGHDDIWDPGHLAAIVEGFAKDPAPDFVTSGLICHFPNGLPGGKVFGLYPEGSPTAQYFFPPSCMAHSARIIDAIGVWRMPFDIRAPVDVDVLLRAHAAGLQFRSTGRVTVHKFTASDRYLCYVQPNADEQEAMLADLDDPGHAQRIARKLEEARRDGTYMTPSEGDYHDWAPGAFARKSLHRRGVLRPRLRPLEQGAVIRQQRESCGLDWWDGVIMGIRLHSRNPRPRFLLPYAAEGSAMLGIRVVHSDRAAFGPLTLVCNGREVTARPRGLRPSFWGWTARYETEVPLLVDAPSLLEFRLDGAQLRKRRLSGREIGFGIGKLWLRPVRA